MIVNNKRKKIVTGACGMIVMLFMIILNMGVAMAELHIECHGKIEEFIRP